MPGEGMKMGQSAIEYLTTFWWAILIMVVAIALLFQLGIFNSTTLSPKAFAGACQVSRPYGPGSSGLVHLEGLCNNEFPQYVSEFTGQGGAWTFQCAAGGACAEFQVPFAASNCIYNQTMVAWSYDLGMGAVGHIYASFGSWTQGVSAIPGNASLGGVVAAFNSLNTLGSTDIEYNDSVIRYEYRSIPSRNQILLRANSILAGGTFEDVWIQTGIVVSNGIAYGYMDGNLVTPASPDIGCIRMDTGSVGIWDRNFNGYITNVQIYNSSLTANQMASLYKEGLGGDPIQLQNLVGWWPLNGNAYDYSGENNNGEPGAIVFSGTYPTGYALSAD